MLPSPPPSSILPSGSRRIPRLLLSLLLLASASSIALDPARLSGQEPGRLFPDRALIPSLLAGARNPNTSASMLAVTHNPDAFGNGVEMEVSIGSALPVLLLSGDSGHRAVVAGIEAAAFARFGLQVLERELIASDWIFAVPVVWHQPGGWIRFRYYHASSHMGDEYARRFEAPGINFSRDAAELQVFRRPTPLLGAYMGARYAYNVHPEASKRWVLRTGIQLEGAQKGRTLLPFAAMDLEWDADAGWGTRLDLRTGVWLPKVSGRRALRVSLGLFTGPSPLGQFNDLRTTQFGVSLQGSL